MWIDARVDRLDGAIRDLRKAGTFIAIGLLLHIVLGHPFNPTAPHQMTSARLALPAAHEARRTAQLVMVLFDDELFESCEGAP